MASAPASLAAFFRPSPELVLALALLEGTLRAPAYRLWAAADFGYTPRERAAWIVPDESEGVRWVNWPNGRRFLSARWNGPVPAGAVAIVHTHPGMVDPKPSPQDVETACRLGVPVYTVSRSGIWKAVPDGSIVSVDDSRWWSACRTGACDDTRNPEFRSARSAPTPAELRNLGTDSAYP
ncbi:MAG: Mov34/MPN/PAD-1 family protein [Thermoanaerobaculia bacterium]|nr:Mov34/MPN/PAD-1 family protein [Thermoanaerobaculia bacterium]